MNVKHLPPRIAGYFRIIGEISVTESVRFSDVSLYVRIFISKGKKKNGKYAKHKPKEDRNIEESKETCLLNLTYCNIDFLDIERMLVLCVVL